MSMPHPPELIAALRAIDTPTLANAIETFKIRPRTAGYMGMTVKCLFPELGVSVGYAVTALVDSTTEEEPGDRRVYYDLWKAVDEAPKPALVVFGSADRNPTHGCHCGEVMASTAQALGAEGLITDSGVRDINEVRALGFQYFAGGVVPSHGQNRIVKVGMPVTVGGLEVRSGDLLHGDVNGVIVVPHEIAAQLPDAVAQIRQRESRMLDAVRRPGFRLGDLAEFYV